MEIIHRVDAWADERVRKMYGADVWDEYIAWFDVADRAAVTSYVAELVPYYYRDKNEWLVSPEDFESLFQGEWDSFKEFVCEVVLADAGISRDAIEWMGSCFDMEQCLADLSDEYYTAYTDRGTVWVYAVNW